MKTQYGNTISEYIQYEAAGGSIAGPKIVTRYYSDLESTWVDFEDINDRTITLSNENKRYGLISFMPPAKEIEFTLNNFNQVYSKDSGDAKSTILKKNLKIQAWTGYNLDIVSPQIDEFDIKDDMVSDNKFYHTEVMEVEVTTGDEDNPETENRLIYDSQSYTGTFDEALITNPYSAITHEPYCFLWSKMGNDTEVTNSEIGVNGAWIGDTAYDPGNFNDGMQNGNKDGNHVKYTQNLGDEIDQNALIFEAWIRPQGWYISKGQAVPNPAPYPNYRTHDLMGFGLNEGISIRFLSNVSSFGLCIYHGTKLLNPNNNISSEIDAANNELVHLLVAVDSSGISGTDDTIQVYWNGNLVLQSSETWTGDSSRTLRLGQALSSSTNWQGVIDNPKIYNVVNSQVITQCLTNMYNESFPDVDYNTYDSTTYDYTGYYLKEYSIDIEGETFYQIKVNTSSDKFDFRYRLKQESDDWSTVNWNAPVELSAGNNTIELPGDPDYPNMQTAVLFKNPEYLSTDDYIVASNISMKREEKKHLFLRGTFILDDPVYEDLYVKCKGRDYTKKSLETEINLPAIQTSTSIVDVMQLVLDRCNIPYDNSEWDDPSIDISLTQAEQEDMANKSGWKWLDMLMDAVNANSSNWRLKTEENGNVTLMFIKTDMEADYSINYFSNIEDVNKSMDADKQLQRITMSNDKLDVESETLLGEQSGYLSTETNITFNYTDSAYVRYTDTEESIVEEVDRTNTSLTLKISSGDYDIKVYGCNLKEAGIYAERGNAENIVRAEGLTHTKENALFTADMCKDYCDYLIQYYGDPFNKITLSMSSNPYLELNDAALVFDLYTYTDKIYTINEIKEEYNEPRLKDTILLEDKGFVLGAYKWDRNNRYPGLNDMFWDIGLVWDQDLEIGGLEPSIEHKGILM